MLTYNGLIIVGGVGLGLVLLCVTSIAYLTRLDRLREASLSLSDNLLPSDGEAQ